MNLWNRFLSIASFGRIGNEDTGGQRTGPGKTSTQANISVTDEKAMQLSAVWRCCEIIVNSIATLPINVTEVVGKKETEAPYDHPISMLLYNRPNRWMKMRDFRKALTFQQVLWNNGYAKIDRLDSVNGKPGKPVAMTPLHPARMQVERTDSGLLYHYTTLNKKYVWTEESILHLKGMGPDGIVGLNRSDYMRESMGLAVSADTFASKQFANGGTPGGVLMVDKFLNDEQRKHLKEIYGGVRMSAEQANELWVLEGGVQYQELARAPDAMQMIESRTHQIVDLARFFGVPAVLIDAGANTSSAWPASFEQQLLAFLTFTLQSYVDEWDSTLHFSLVDLAEKRKIKIAHDENDFIRMDSKSKAEYWSKLRNSGLATSNEARPNLRLPISEQAGADDLTVQSNLLLISELEKLTNAS